MPRYKVPLYKKGNSRSLPSARYVTVKAETAELAQAKAAKRHSNWFTGPSKFYREVPERDRSMDLWMVLFVLFGALSVVMMISDPPSQQGDEVNCTLRGCQ